VSAARDQAKAPEAAPLLAERPEAGILRLVLNRPAAYNSLSSGLMLALQEALDAARTDPDTRVVIIAGAGPGFCAGHDLREVRALPSRADLERLFKQCSRLMQSIVALPKPVIAEIHGIATAAGCQLVASCDLAVAADTARFATPGVNLGLFCSTPMVALSRNVGRKHAMEMLLLGEMADAAKAVDIGLINIAVPEGSLKDATLAYARRIAGKSPLTLKIGKEAFYRQLELPLAQAYDYAAQVMTENMLARDATEGIDAFLQKRQPVWQGC